MTSNTMNTYSTKFFSLCPTNEVRIEYALTIQSDDMIPVEHIIAEVSTLTRGYHEDFADVLFARFGGKQTLAADHHGVAITTHRTAPAAI